MNSSSAISHFPLLDLTPETRRHLLGQLPINPPQVRSVALTCKQLRAEMEDYRMLLLQDLSLQLFIATAHDPLTPEQLATALSRLRMDMPAVVIVPRVRNLTLSLKKMAATQAAAGLRGILNQAARFPEEHRFELKLLAMSSNLAVHHPQTGNPEALVLFKPADQEEAKLVLHCIANQSYEHYQAVRARPARHALEIELHTQALTLASQYPGAVQRPEWLNLIACNFVHLLYERKGTHTAPASAFLRALIALIPQQTPQTQADLLFQALQVQDCLAGAGPQLDQLAQNLLSNTSDQDLLACWDQVAQFAWMAKWDGHEELAPALLQRALAFEDPAHRLEALEKLAQAAHKHGNSTLMSDCMHEVCKLNPPTLEQMRSLLARLDTPILLERHQTMKPGQIAGMMSLMKAYQELDVRQLMNREILPRLRSLESPEQRMQAAVEVSQRALKDYFPGDEYEDFLLFYRGMLEAVFHDSANWTTEQQQTGQALLKTLREQAGNPRHLLSPGVISQAARKALDEFQPH